MVNAGEILANLKPTQASDIVNTGGLENIDAPLAFKDGKIGIFAENDVVNAGRSKPMRAAAAKPAASLSKPAAISACGKAR